jgi:hypothetical protein
MSNKNKQDRQPLYAAILRNVMKTIANRLSGDMVNILLDKIKDMTKGADGEIKNKDNKKVKF